MAVQHRYQQLENWLAEGIKDGRWSVGERLPSIRSLCQELELSKATVIHALNRLEARGLVMARPMGFSFKGRSVRRTFQGRGKTFQHKSWPIELSRFIIFHSPNPTMMTRSGV